MPRPQAVYIGLGSNIGRRQANLRAALKALSSLPGYRLVAVSSSYVTSPVGPRQPDFFNAVAKFMTIRRPEEVLADVKGIERAMGRRPARRWGPRIIDLDVLFYGRTVCAAPQLTLPHPRLHERRFVLEPLAELSPGLVHPLLRTTVRRLRDRARLTYPGQRVNIIKK
jgi:2-amino-4-hydroxy-6-hydroxymethyldihydropteridine diphosphokinase